MRRLRTEIRPLRRAVRRVEKGKQDDSECGDENCPGLELYGELRLGGVPSVL